MKSPSFEAVLTKPELKAWDAVKAVIRGVLGKNRVGNCEELVDDMMKAFKKIKVHMSFKIHLLHFHMDVLLKQLATESDEHGERYHQIALPFEHR